MSRYSGGFKTNGAGSTTLPIAGLTATTGVRPRVKEVGVFNTTVTPLDIALRRITAIGTPGSGREEIYMNDNSQTALATLLDTWTVTPTFVTGNIRVASLGAAIGSGVIWTFGGDGLVIPNTTGDGVVVVPLVGTGQVCDVYFEWEE